MKLMLDLPALEASFSIEHHHKLFFIGSCFSEYMATYFKERKFNTLENPFGVLYNPVSIANSILQIKNQHTYDVDSFYSNDDLVGSWDHHSKISELNEVKLKECLEKKNESSLKFLQETDVAFITLGTAWVQYHIEKKGIVANNHKAPKDLFEQRLLSLKEITEALQQTIINLKSIKADIKIILTLSPVRHSKQGLVENNLSKARLLQCIHSLCETSIELVYLPSYEIIIDALRDYRFYASDLVHPNKLATDFLWSYLNEKLIAESAQKVMKQSLNITNAIQHKVMHPNSAKTKLFIKRQLEKIAALKSEYDYINLEDEKNHFENL